MKECTCKGYNLKTRKIEQFIDGAFWRNDHPMENVSKANVEIIVEALMKVYHKDYCIYSINLEPFSSDGMSIQMKLDVLDNWKEEKINSNIETQLCSSLNNIIEVLGKPTNVFESGDSFYAEWTRNMVVWF